MEIPKLKKGYHSVIVVEFNTGIVLNKKFTYSINQQDCIHIFKNLLEAKQFIQNNVIQKPELEFALYSDSGEFIESFSKKTLI